MNFLVITKKHTYNITSLVEFLYLSIVLWGLLALGGYLESLM